MSHPKRRICGPLFLGTILVFLAGPLLATPPVPLGRDAGLRQAEALLDAGSVAAAIEIFERLNQLEGGRCGICLLQLAEAQAKRGDNPRAVDAARRALGLLSDRQERSWAHAFLSYSLLDPAADREILAEAEEHGRQALELAEDVRLRRWSFETLGTVLWQQKHYDDVVDLARVFLAANPGADDAQLAQRALCAARAVGNVPGPTVEPRPEAGTPAPVSAPKKRYQPHPGRVRDADGEPIQGQVLAEGIVDTEGCFTNLQVQKGLDPELDQGVLDALSLWTFQPATLAGRPVRAWYRVTLNFAPGS
jgi:TonB family protein